MPGSPSSDCASSPWPRSFFPAVKIGAFSVWMTEAPGEKPNDHFTPFEAVNASGFVIFSIRTVNWVGLLSPPTAMPATLKVKHAAALRIFLNTFVYLLLSIYFGAELSPRMAKVILIGLDVVTPAKVQFSLVRQHQRRAASGGIHDPNR